MPSVCIYFQVHQPFRVKKYRIFDIGKNHNYFNQDDESNLNNLKILKKVSEKCYLPTNKLLLKLLKRHPGFKISYSLSGVFLEALEKNLPTVLKSFQDLVETGQVEILSETYHHSLSFLYSRSEFLEQIRLHQKIIKRLFNKKPMVFRNTELIFNNDLAKFAQDLGFAGILAEGADHVLGWQSPNYLYQVNGASKIKLLLKNYRLSDDIAFRFSEKDWSEFPLTADKFSSWISEINGNGEVVNLFMDYETFGEHQWEDKGIFEFLEDLPEKILKNHDNNFVTPTEAVRKYPVRGRLDIPNFISWADVERDLSAWLSNAIQHDAISSLYSMEKSVLKTGDRKIIDDFRKLQTSDHFYYMCTKWFSDGDVHKYFNPYESPYEAFISFMNVLKDLELRIEEISQKSKVMSTIS